MDLGLQGMKAILGAATKGLGRATAELLAAEGVDVAICARNEAGVTETVQSLKKKGGAVYGSVADLKDPEAYRTWINEAATSLGGCDIFVSFASAGGAQASEEAWKAAFEVDVMATWRGIDAVMPWLVKSDAASIVVIGTNVAIEPGFGPQPYAAMKAAIVHHAAALAQKLGSQGIRVNTVSPGPIFVEGGDWDRIKNNRRELYDATTAKIPVGRLGEPVEIARTVAFLSSPHSGFISGTNVVIDGGMSRRVQF
jgi:3-oxoacyl-[acyl-carrier protein] reductase